MGTYSLLVFWGCCVLHGWGRIVIPALGNVRDPDVDECLSTMACPAYATCTNTVGSFYCTCKRGFLPSNRAPARFSTPGVQCWDMDECAVSPQPCGPHAVCTNLPGRFSCSCLPGFSSPTGNRWTPFKGSTFSCTDARTTPAPHTGSATTPRDASAVSASSSTAPPAKTESTPVTVSSPPPAPTPPGAASAPAHPALRPAAASRPPEAATASVQTPTDASKSRPPVAQTWPAPTPRVPPATAGPASVPCRGGSPTHGDLSCTGVPSRPREDMAPHQCRAGAAPRGRDSFCSLINTTFSILDDVSGNRSGTVSLQRAARGLGQVVQQAAAARARSELSAAEARALASELLRSVEETALAALRTPGASGGWSARTEHLDIDTKVINEDFREKNASVHLKAKGDDMKIRCSVIQESASTGTTGVAFASFTSMESILDVRFFQDPQAPEAKAERQLKVNSRVVQGIMTGEKKDNLSGAVLYSLQHLQPKRRFERSICASWSTGVAGGEWTRSGCEILEASETHTVCSCNRMLNLAIIMASGELTVGFPLFVISHVGTSISLACLGLAIATFLLCPSVRGHSTCLHLHLCLCLLLAKIIFLTCVDKTHNQLGCSIIAGVLHYLFLACFFWMLVEAVMLFLMVRNLKVVNYFSSRNIRMPYLCAFGYGLPGLVVAVSASAQPQGYGTHDRCWLNTESGLIWSFLGPVCVIIAINSVLLTWTLCILRQKLSSVNAEVSTLKDTRLLTFKAFAQLFVLGCSWVLGVFQIGPVASAMAYLFTIVNSLQGAFIFTIHCLLNRQVREQYKRWVCRKTKPGTQSQTSGVLLSSMPSSARTG